MDYDRYPIDFEKMATMLMKDVDLWVKPNQTIHEYFVIYLRKAYSVGRDHGWWTALDKEMEERDAKSNI